MKKWKHILFDLDGTLIDSKPGITKGVSLALKHFQIEVNDLSRLEGYIGPPLLDSFMTLHKLSEKQANEAIARYREYYTSAGIFEYTVYPGIAGLLKDLVNDGKKLYVATSKPTPFAEKILANEQLDHLFSGIYGSFLDGRRTAKADVIETVLIEYRLPLAETVMIGDRREDIIGAHKNRVHAIGVRYGYGSKQELQEARADQIAVDVSDLRGKLLGIQDHK